MSRRFIYGWAAVGGMAMFMAASRLPIYNRAAETGPVGPGGVGVAPGAKTGGNDAAETRTLVTLVRSPSVQTDLKLDAAQAVAVNEAVANIDQPLWQLRDVSKSEGSERLLTLRSKFETALRETLRPEQQRRLQQLQWRSKGLRALNDPRFTDQLDLTDAQKARLLELLASLDPANPDAGKADSAKIAEVEKKAMAVLTEHQRRRLEELLGPAFDFGKVRQVAVKAPEISGIEGWVNSSPLKLADLRGKVVVLHFWTFGCINCIHNLPIYKTWYDELPRDKLVIVGVHTPETAAEHQFSGLQAAAKQRDLKFPIAMDLKSETWKAWGNSTWPAVYLIDRHGNVRYWWTGEMKWKGAEGDKWMRQKIEELVAEKE